MLIWLTIVCSAMQLIDGRRCVISFHWRRPFRNVKTIIGNCTRIIAAALSIFLLWSFTWNLGVNGSWSYNWAKSLGDNSTLWSTATDATNNGPTMTFYDWRMWKDKPENYNEETMAALAKRYKKSAKNTNGPRANNLTDDTVIMILSESFSDPTRVPGVELTEDPMPNIRAIKNINFWTDAIASYWRRHRKYWAPGINRLKFSAIWWFHAIALSRTSSTPEGALYIQSNLEQQVWQKRFSSVPPVLQRHVSTWQQL